jgi:hypothetical protein
MNKIKGGNVMKKNAKKSGLKKPLIIGAVGAGVAALGLGLGKAFKSMKASAKAQHEVDKANFAAAKAESKAQWEEAKAMGKPSVREAMLQAEREAQIAEANERKAAAEARIEATKQ